MQILPRAETPGSRLGGIVQDSLGNALQELAAAKVADLQRQYEPLAQQQQFTKGIGQLIGPRTARFLSAIPSAERKGVWQNIPALMELEKFLSQQEGQPQAGGMSALAQPGAPQQEAVPQGGLDALQQAVLAQQPQVSPQTEGQAPQLVPQAQDPQQRIRELLAEAFTSPKERRDIETLDIRKQKEAREVAKEVREFSKPYIERARAAEENIRDYDTMIELAKKGDIRSPNTNILLSKLGLEGFNENFETQAAKKITARLSQNARTAFGPGARITNFLEKTYQQSLPSIWNTKEGIESIARSNKYVNKAILEENRIRKKVIAENKGKLPGDIEDQIYDRVKPVIDKLQKKAMDALISPLDKKKSFEAPDQIPDNIPYKDTQTGQLLINQNGIPVPYERG